jgi:hypothetical protein
MTTSIDLPCGCTIPTEAINAPGGWTCAHGTRLETLKDTRDAIASLHAKNDQLGASAQGIARTIAGYHNTLTASGIEHDHAQELTLMYQANLLASIFGLAPTYDAD